MTVELGGRWRHCNQQTAAAQMHLFCLSMMSDDCRCIHFQLFKNSLAINGSKLHFIPICDWFTNKFLPSLKWRVLTCLSHRRTTLSHALLCGVALLLLRPTSSCVDVDPLFIHKLRKLPLRTNIQAQKHRPQNLILIEVALAPQQTDWF